MNPRLDNLHPYPFQKLAQLLEGNEPPPQPPIALSIGEPKHPAPDHVLATLGNSLAELRSTITDWATQRFNLPGLRSGFAAGDADCLARFLRYRTYHGCAMPIHHQKASIAAWQNEAHVAENRDAYRHKFDTVLPILEP